MNRLWRLTLVCVTALALAACSGLPTDSGVGRGLTLGEVPANPDVVLLLEGPRPGASPEEIVSGFIDAGTSPADDWSIARQFLAGPVVTTWRPEAAVSIDRSRITRELSIQSGGPDADTARVQVVITPVASVDGAGSYSESPGGTAEAPYELERNDEGEWRIVSAPDGIILDGDSFPLVFRRYSLQYFDPSFEHLVPDPRWFPRRSRIATTITQAVVSGTPSGWLAEAVRSAFPEDVELALLSVPVGESDQVAEVALTAPAASLDALTLARMRTQLEKSLNGTGISQVRFTVDGRELAAELVEVVPNRIDANTIVLTAEAFGSPVGMDIVPVEGVSGPIVAMADQVRSIDVAGDSLAAAVQLHSGAVVRVEGDAVIELDDRAGLIAPILDTNGFVWTVPADRPAELVAWSASGERFAIATDWSDAAAISHLRVAPDGARAAATVTIGGQEWVGLAGIIRDDDGAPLSLGTFEPLSRLPGPGLGLAWLGEDALGVLTREGETPQLIERVIGGPASVSIVPGETVAIAGANAIAGARLLSDTGVVSVKLGASWQEAVTDVLVLATQSGK